jgi:putative membrane protein
VSLEQFPPLNAFLNTLTAVLLGTGFVLVKNQKLKGHKICMIAATFTSAVFLCCYLYYHAHHGVTKYRGQGAIRTIYFVILTTHTILAAIQVPLILMTLYRAFRGELAKHKTLARITLPIWLYVSLTGVIIYYMLYQL